jgi:crotonobetainyl-CoA:carnitine CoA-transferase CaiB-like acyl-CoA transferase
MLQSDLPLSIYRVLDLTDEKGCLAGKILADLGSDVIKIEPPGGSSARRVGPFYKDIPDPEKSLFWFAYNTGKRGITLNLESADGKDIFFKMIKTADFVVESFRPGYLASVGLDYEKLKAINPRLIMASISPWGQTGPYHDYEDSDLVLAAMGGQLNAMGYAGRHPLRISIPQSYVNASTHAAVGMMIANYARKRTGRGQQIDVAAQNVMVQTSGNGIPNWQTYGRILHRAGERRAGMSANADLRQFYRCRDGFVMFSIVGGAGGMRNNREMVAWMASVGMADDFLKGIDWSTFDKTTVDQETIDRIETQVAAFLMQHDKEELYEDGGKRHIMLYPVYTPREMLEDKQLAARRFWVQIEHDELNDAITYPGAFAISSEYSCIVKRRAPLIGEHNEEIYTGELGLSKEDVISLVEKGVI